MEAANLTRPSKQDVADRVQRILSESPIGLTVAARRLGVFREGKPCHPGTVSRWASAGVKLADGTVLKLETVRLNGRLVTSWPAVLRFASAQQGESIPCRNPTGSRSPAARRKAADVADKRLAAAGI